MGMSDPFWQRALLAAISPLVAAFVGTLIVGLFAARITEAAQLRRQDRNMREQLVVEMTQAASTIYIETQRYWRGTNVETVTRNASPSFAPASMSVIFLPMLPAKRWRCECVSTSSPTHRAAYGMP